MPVEGFYLETIDGLFFAVKGLVHPPDRIIAVLRYLPDPAGDRRRAGVAYRRVYHFDEQEALLAQRDPRYITFDPVFGERLQGVPRDLIAAVHDPRVGLAQLHSRFTSRSASADASAEAMTGSRDLGPVERDTLAFAELLTNEAGVPSSVLGVSGSVLIGLHTLASDLDLVVYGEQACRSVQSALRRLLAGPRAGLIRPLDEQGLTALYAARVKDTRMPFADFARHERRKVIQGTFSGREYFIRFVPDPTKIEEQYGDLTYRPAGRATIRARVTDDRQALFTPCCYGVTDVQFAAGKPAVDLTEIVSFRGRFCEQAWEGETVVAAGKLENVYNNKRDQVHHRLLLGGQPEDFMVTEVTT
jgi:predicted nucleotidyltransferase